MPIFVNVLSSLASSCLSSSIFYLLSLIFYFYVLPLTSYFLRPLSLCILLPPSSLCSDPRSLAFLGYDRASQYDFILTAKSGISRAPLTSLEWAITGGMSFSGRLCWLLSSRCSLCLCLLFFGIVLSWLILLLGCNSLVPHTYRIHFAIAHRVCIDDKRNL